MGFNSGFKGLISSYISTELNIKQFTENFLKHRSSGKVILLSAGHRDHCSSSLQLHTAVQNKVSIIRLPGNCTHTLQPFNSSFFGRLKSYFQKESVACKNHSVSRGSRLTGFAWSKVTSVGVVVNAFDSKGIYPFNRNRVPEYLFAISGTSKTITSMEKSTSKYGYGLYKLYFSNQSSKCVICLSRTFLNPLKPELNSICYLLALLGAHHFLHVSRIRVK